MNEEANLPPEDHPSLDLDLTNITSLERFVSLLEALLYDPSTFPSIKDINLLEEKLESLKPIPSSVLSIKDDKHLAQCEHRLDKAIEDENDKAVDFLLESIGYYQDKKDWKQTKLVITYLKTTRV